MQLPAEHRERLEREARQARRARQRAGRGPGHPEIDRRTLEYARVIAAKIDQDPELVRVGLDNIARWTRQNNGYLPRAHAEWKQLIETRTWPELRRILLAETDEGQRLRSSHPFKGIISQAERERIMAQYPLPSH